jgi:hypothetical protein
MAHRLRRVLSCAATATTLTGGLLATFGDTVRLRDTDGHADLFTSYLLFKGASTGITTTGVRNSIRADFL